MLAHFFLVFNHFNWRQIRELSRIFNG